jgi:hypothetical protein
MIKMRIIPIEIQDKKVLVQKDTDRYINENDLTLAIEDIIKDNILELKENIKIDLSSICDLMFSIIYRGIIKIEENKDVWIDNIVFEVC